jgi:uncharacterized protein DUF4242
MVYVVERYLPGFSRGEVERALERVERAARQLTAVGEPVRYLGSTIVLEDEACFCQFEAPSPDVIAAVNRRADLPFDRIVEAVAVLPTGGGA